jgi:hypothetical protein
MQIPYETVVAKLRARVADDALLIAQLQAVVEMLQEQGAAEPAGQDATPNG